MKSQALPLKGRILRIRRRKGARSAARRCGWKPRVIDVPARIEQTPGAFGGAIAGTLAIAGFLPLAAEIPIRPQIETYPLENANAALADLKFGAVHGAKVLLIDG